MDATSREAERDRIPVFRQFRDLSTVSTQALERAADRLVYTIRRHGHRCCRHLYEALVDIERELIDRTVEDGRRLASVDVPVGQFPALDVVRITHRSGRSVRLFTGGAS